MAVQRFRTVFVTPDDDVKSVLDALPDSATVSHDTEIYGLTDLVFIGKIIDAAKRGVHCRANNDRSQEAGPKDKEAIQQLVNAAATGLPIEVKVTESTRGAIDHLKVDIIDGENGALDDSSSVFYGSYNFSDGAESQDNCAVWTNDPGEVARFQAKFDEDWTQNKQLPEWQPKAAA